MNEAISLIMAQNRPSGSQIGDKKKTNYWIAQHVFVILGSGLQLKKVQIVVSKRLRILPKIRGDNSARGLVKIFSSASAIICLVYWTYSIKCPSSICLVNSLPAVWLWTASFELYVLGFSDFLHVARNL